MLHLSHTALGACRDFPRPRHEVPFVSCAHIPRFGYTYPSFKHSPVAAPPGKLGPPTPELISPQVVPASRVTSSVYSTIIVGFRLQLTSQ